MTDTVSKLLIVNRGEIALRVVRTAREMGIPTVVVYAEQDRHSQYVKMADEAFLLSGDTYADTYLNEDLLIDILRRSGADAVHPGYGFLSEVPSFADKVIEAGATWVGPSSRALTDLGDKISARRVAVYAKVPPVPGISHSLGDMRVLLDFAHTHGYPLMLKRADGGGGRGITLVRDDDELRGFYLNHNAVQGGDLDEYFVERFIDHGRHVETQCGRDSHGNFTVYSTRDCSVQRRNQKLIEESPAPCLDAHPGVRERMHKAARDLTRATGYVGVGTIEFLFADDGSFYFMEMNTRLQVEHPVTEFVSGVDLVKWQLRVASGAELPFSQDDVHIQNHAIECRINAETPEFLPSCGDVTMLHVPGGPQVRFDSALYVGAVVPPYYDSLLGKLIVCSSTREEAIRKMRSALGELVIEGVAENSELHLDILANPEFVSGNYHTNLMEHLYE